MLRNGYKAVRNAIFSSKMATNKQELCAMNAYFVDKFPNIPPPKR
jgi:hypothetical protein